MGPGFYSENLAHHLGSHYISKKKGKEGVRNGGPCTKVGIVRHVAHDDLDEGSFVFTQYDEDGTTAVAVLTEDGNGKRRRVLPSVDRGTQTQFELE